MIKILQRFYWDGSIQVIKRLFILVFNNSTAHVVDDPSNNTNNRVVRDNHRT